VVECGGEEGDGMRYGFYIKSPREELPVIAGERVRLRAQGEMYNQLRKGVRLMDIRIRIGYDGDDVVKDMVTIICEANMVKVPRFVRNYLLKKRFRIGRYTH
jgi:hypothetical protein